MKGRSAALVQASGRRARSGWLARQEERAAYLFLLPWLIGLVVFLLGPIVASLLISMTNWNMISSAQWVGFDNYREMFFEDRNFWQSIRVTSYYTLLSVPIYLVASLALSLLLNLRLRRHVHLSHHHCICRRCSARWPSR